jgi:hypothetical protein
MLKNLYVLAEFLLEAWQNKPQTWGQNEDTK